METILPEDITEQINEVLETRSTEKGERTAREFHFLAAGDAIRSQAAAHNHSKSRRLCNDVGNEAKVKSHSATQEEIKTGKNNHNYQCKLISRDDNNSEEDENNWYEAEIEQRKVQDKKRTWIVKDRLCIEQD